MSDAVSFCIIFVSFNATSTHCGYITLISSIKFRCGLNLIKLATFTCRGNSIYHLGLYTTLLRISSPVLADFNFKEKVLPNNLRNWTYKALEAEESKNPTSKVRGDDLLAFF